MLGKYMFLKYGRPMVAAAPLMLLLNTAPSPTHACTGSANDPVHCANNDGQLINGFPEFYDSNLGGIPGSSTVPGDNFFSNDFFNDDDADLASFTTDDDDDFELFDLDDEGDEAADGSGGSRRVSLEDSDDFSRLLLGFFGARTPGTLNNPIFAEDLTYTPERKFAIGNSVAPAITSNVTFVAPPINNTYEIAGRPELHPVQPTFTGVQHNTSAVAPPAISTGATPYDLSGSMFSPSDGQVAPTYHLFVNSLPNADDFSSCSAQGSAATCGEALSTLEDRLQEVFPDPQTGSVIMSAVPLDDSTSNRFYFTVRNNYDLSAGNGEDVALNPDIAVSVDPNAPVVDFSLVDLPNDDDADVSFSTTGLPIDDDADFGDLEGHQRNLYQYYSLSTHENPDEIKIRFVNPEQPETNASTQVTEPAGNTVDSTDVATPRIVNNLASGLQRLRERARSETDPEKKAQLEQRVLAFERTIGHFGTASMRTAVAVQDSNTAPVPGR